MSETDNNNHKTRKTSILVFVSDCGRIFRPPLVRSRSVYFRRASFYAAFCSNSVLVYLKGRVLYYQVGGGGGYIFMWWAKHLTTPPPPVPLEKNSRPPQIYDKNVCDPPPPQPSPQTPLFLSCCFKWGVINIASYLISKLYSDILSVAKLYSISAVEWADN